MGHTARKCPAAQDRNLIGALNAHEFQKAKDRQDADVPSADVADELGFPVEEINLAYESNAYGMYVIKRKKRGV